MYTSFLKKKDQQLDELQDFKDAMSIYDFSNKIPKREKPPKNNHRE